MLKLRQMVAHVKAAEGWCDVCSRRLYVNWSELRSMGGEVDCPDCGSRLPIAKGA